MFRDSSKALLAGLMWAIITVRLFPPRESWMGTRAGCGQQGPAFLHAAPARLFVMPSWCVRVCVCVSLSLSLTLTHTHIRAHTHTHTHTLSQVLVPSITGLSPPPLPSPLLPSSSFFSKVHVRKFQVSRSGSPGFPSPPLIHEKEERQRPWLAGNQRGKSPWGPWAPSPSPLASQVPLHPTAGGTVVLAAVRGVMGTSV